MTRHATPHHRPFAAVPVLIGLTLVLGRVPIHCTAFDIEPPTRLLGLTRVDDRLVLSSDAVFGR